LKARDAVATTPNAIRLFSNNDEQTRGIPTLEVSAFEVQVGTKICRLRDNENNMGMRSNYTFGRLCLSRQKIRVSMQ
jgi:hypothetical protein